MSRLKKKKNEKEKQDFGELPTYLDRNIRDTITSGLDESLQPVSENKKPYLEWLAEAFGLTPAWKKNKQIEGGGRRSLERW